jgi:hypothetical protein
VRHCSTLRQRLRSPPVLPAILLCACEMMSWKSPYRRRCRRYGGSLRQVWREGNFKSASRAVCVHLRGAFIHGLFKSPASACVQRCGERFGADVTPDPRRAFMRFTKVLVTKVFGLAAVGALLVLAAPAERANALSLSNPGAAAAVQEDARLATTEVHWRHHHHHRWHRWHHHHRHHHHHHWRRW